MLKNINFKKEYLLIIGTVIILWISYQLAFKKTIQAMQLNHQLKSEIADATNLSYQPGYLPRKSLNLDGILSRYKMDSLSLRGNTIALIAQLAEKEHVKLSEVPNQDALYRNERFIIQRLDFEGDYFSLLRMLNTMQTTNGIGIPRSLLWKAIDKSPGNPSSKKLILQVCFEVSR